MASTGLFIERRQSKEILEQNWKLQDRVCYLEGLLKRLQDAPPEKTKALIAFYVGLAGIHPDDGLTHDDIALLKQLEGTLSHATLERLKRALRKYNEAMRE